MNKPDVFSADKASPKIFGDSKTTHETQKKLEEWVPLFDEYCAKMHEFGAVFLEEFKKTQCDIVFDFDEYTQNTDNLRWGQHDYISNEIHFGKAALCNKREFLITLFHEAIHAIQYNYCASLYGGSPDTGYPFIVLSPYAKIQQNHMMERDAYAKESYFEYLYDWIEDKGEIDSEVWSEETESMGSGMRRVARNVLHGEVLHDSDKQIYVSIIDTVLGDFEKHLEWYEERDREDTLIFTSLGVDDIWHLGNSLNINSLYENYDDVVLHEKIKMNDQQKERLEALNATLNIKESELPSFTDTLAKIQLTPEEYLKMFRTMYDDEED